MKSISDRIQTLLLPTLVGALIVLTMKSFVLINTQNMHSMAEPNNSATSSYTLRQLW